MVVLLYYGRTFFRVPLLAVHFCCTVLQYVGTFLTVLRYGGAYLATPQYGGTFFAVLQFDGNFVPVPEYGGCNNIRRYYSMAVRT